MNIREKIIFDKYKLNAIKLIGQPGQLKHWLMIKKCNVSNFRKDFEIEALKLLRLTSEILELN